MRRIWCGLVGMAIGCLGLGEGAIGQIVPDGTLGSQVTGGCDGAGVCNIINGSVRSGNLFHSFQQFSLPNQGTAQFTTLPTTENVIVRVTGVGQPFISNINGVISTNNPANFFLINPNGIQFGANAGLDIGGSFLATTAERMQFQDGNVLRTGDPTPLLTVSVPTGLQFGQTPQDIQMKGAFFSTINNKGAFTDFILAGGNIFVDNAWVYTLGNRIEFVGAGAFGKVELNPGNNLRFLDDSELADITLINDSRLFVAANPGGDINLTGRNINSVRSSFYAGILGGAGNSGDQAGSLRFSATDTIHIRRGSLLLNSVDNTGNGNAGNIDISTRTLFVTQGSSIRAGTDGTGNAGNVVINVRERLLLERSVIENTSTSKGNGGNIQVAARSLLVDGRIVPTLSSGVLEIGAALSTEASGTGNSGNIDINTQDEILLDRGSAIASQAFGEGNAGDIYINAGSLIGKKISVIQSVTNSQGNAGNVKVNVRDQISFSGGFDDSIGSGIRSQVLRNASGSSGNVDITARAIILQDDANLSTSTLGQGNAGDVQIKVRDEIRLNGASTIFSTVQQGAVGQGGNIQVVAGALTLLEGSQLDASTFGKGSSGNVIVNVRDGVTVDGVNLNPNPKFSNRSSTLFSEVAEDASGNGGDIRIVAGSLTVTNGGQLDAKTSGKGDAGSVFITARDQVIFDGKSPRDGRPSRALSSVNSKAVGNGGNIKISASAISLTNGAVLTAETRGAGNAGSIIVNAHDSIVLSSGSEISARTATNFKARDIILTADNLQVSNARITVDSQTTGETGNILMNVRSSQLRDRASIVAEAKSQNGGDITFNNADILLLRGGSLISTTAGTEQAGGNGGDININSKFIVAVPKENSDIRANAFSGTGGNVLINTQGLFGITPLPLPNDNLSDITASSELGTQGSVAILQPDVRPEQGINELPTDLIDPSNQISKECPRGYTNRPMGSFIVTGKGGIPTNPIDTSPPLTPLPPLISSNENPPNVGLSPIEPSRNNQSAANGAIVEAQGWYRNKDGRIHLVAKPQARSLQALSTVFPCVPNS